MFLVSNVPHEDRTHEVCNGSLEEFCTCLREVYTGLRIWTYRNVVVDTRGGKKGGDVGVD